MEVSGDDAKSWNAVRLDSFAVINDGMLVSADCATGAVKWKDKTDQERTLTLGDHAIRLVRKR